MALFIDSYVISPFTAFYTSIKIYSGKSSSLGSPSLSSYPSSSSLLAY